MLETTFHIHKKCKHDITGIGITTLLNLLKVKH